MRKNRATRMVPRWERGDAVKVIGGKYTGKEGKVVGWTQHYLKVQHSDTGSVEKSLKGNCEPKGGERTASMTMRGLELSPQLEALVKAMAVLVGESGADLEDVVYIFMVVAEKATERKMQASKSGVAKEDDEW